jgi:hypothetical protein
VVAEGYLDRHIRWAIHLCTIETLADLIDFGVAKEITR